MDAQGKEIVDAFKGVQLVPCPFGVRLAAVELQLQQQQEQLQQQREQLQQQREQLGVLQQFQQQQEVKTQKLNELIQQMVSSHCHHTFHFFIH